LPTQHKLPVKWVELPQNGQPQWATLFSPSGVNLFFGHLEEKIYIKTTNKPDQPQRYTNDGFFYWTKGPEKLEEFKTFLKA
jgi:hypothetical protein